MSVTQVICTSATVSILVIAASVGLFSYAAANGVGTIPDNLHGGFKRMHMGNSHDEKMQHIKSYCNEGGNQKLRHMVSYIEDRFEFSDTQSAQWNNVVNALYSEEGTIKIICDKVLIKDNHETTPARMELMETVVLTGLEAMQRIRPTVEAFYSSLDDKQKKILDNLHSHRSHPRHM